jgi:hypothetical protein
MDVANGPNCLIVTLECLMHTLTHGDEHASMVMKGSCMTLARMARDLQRGMYEVGPILGSCTGWMEALLLVQP